VPRLNGDNLRRLVLDDAAVGILDVDLTVREEADVGVHAEIGADGWLHVHRPPESDWIDHALDARRTGVADIQLDVSDVPALGAFDRREERRPNRRAGRAAPGLARRGRFASGACAHSG
jgi:hypothetical protein